MIDQDRIAINSVSILKSIQQRTPTRFHGLYELHNILDSRILVELEHYLSAVSPQHCWQTMSWHKQAQARSKISWDADTVIEELHESFSSVTMIINEIFAENHKHFWGISIWKDSPGFDMNWHTDNPDIDVAVQIYLFGQPGLGTVFKVGNDELLVPGLHNSGYLVLHTGDQKIPHRTENMVPDGFTRYSLYAVWSRFPKAETDAQ